MRRTKAWWARLTKAERIALWHYEHAGAGRGCSMLPEDCRECPICSTPALGGGLCSGCSAGYDRILNKANGTAATPAGDAHED